MDKQFAGDPFAMPLRAGSSLRLKSGCAQDDTTYKVRRIQAAVVGIEQTLRFVSRN